jgi:hypothetical protein
MIGKKAIAIALFKLDQHRIDDFALPTSGDLASHIHRLVQPRTRHHIRLAGGFATVVLMVAAPALASERAAEREFRCSERQTEALIAVASTAPGRADRDIIGEALKRALTERADALVAVEAAVLRGSTATTPSANQQPLLRFKDPIKTWS